LPEHQVVRDERGTKVWNLFVAGQKIASFTTFSMGARGVVFCIKDGTGWTKEMADQAFRDHLGKERHEKQN